MGFGIAGHAMSFFRLAQGRMMEEGGWLKAGVSVVNERKLTIVSLGWYLAEGRMVISLV